MPKDKNENAPLAIPIGRRAVLRHAGLVLTGLAAPSVLLGRDAFAADDIKSAANTDAIKIADTATGTTVSAYSAIFKDYHLTGRYKINWVPAGSGQVQNLLVARALDVGRFGPIGLAQAALQGHDLVFIGALHRSTAGFLVPKSSPYQSIEDLKGRKIGSSGPSTDEFKLTKIAFHLSGWDYGKEFITVPGSPLAIESLLRRGDVDAISIGQPGINRLLAEGFRQIGSVGDLWKKATGDEVKFSIGSTVSRAWIQENRQRAEDVAGMFVTAIKTLGGDPAVIRKYAAKFGFDPENKEAIDLLVKNLPGALQPGWNDAVLADIDKQIEIAVRAGLVASVPGKSVYEKW
jgi:ABC-type nitrate/sulfonate/bicarbonate transport system substrate-binding protein